MATIATQPEALFTRTKQAQRNWTCSTVLKQFVQLLVEWRFHRQKVLTFTESEPKGRRQGLTVSPFVATRWLAHRTYLGDALSRDVPKTSSWTASERPGKGKPGESSKRGHKGRSLITRRTLPRCCQSQPAQAAAPDASLLRTVPPLRSRLVPVQSRGGAPWHSPHPNHGGAGAGRDHAFMALRAQSSSSSSSE